MAPKEMAAARTVVFWAYGEEPYDCHLADKMGSYRFKGFGELTSCRVSALFCADKESCRMNTFYEKRRNQDAYF